MYWPARILFISLLISGAAPADLLSPIEATIIDELNRVRQDPGGYANFLEEQRVYYSGDVLAFPGAPHIRTAEGVAALEQAIKALRSMEPAPELTISAGLCLAARDHVERQGPLGLVGHASTNLSEILLKSRRHAQNPVVVAENIIYGSTNPANWIVLRLLADDGAPDRGHRKNLLDPRYRFIGIACGPHANYEGMCVMDFASRYTDERVAGANN
jgi:uncharacterized protein YkwD